MRSITIKLIFSFLAISLVSILLIVLFVRFATYREFRRFTETNDRSTIMDTLQDYYSAHGSWEGIDSAELFIRFPVPNNSPPPRPYSSSLMLTDRSGKVIRAGSGFQLGASIPANELRRGTPIQVDGQTVGYLIFAPPPFDENSPERNFLNRTTQLLIYSALATTGIALVLGILLSRTLTSPIRELTLATHAVSEGDLSQQVSVRSQDELGELAMAFNKMSSELARSINTRRQMTADIAHELRTPLSLILGHAEAVHDGVLPPTIENFEIIREEAGRLEHLVDDLRTLSLADAGELSIEKQSVDVKKLLQDIASAYLYRVRQKNIGLDLDMPSELASIQADANRLTQVVTNILDNALRYTRENGKVVLAAQQLENKVRISVRDSGPGIVSGEDVNRIFDRFYRLNVSRDRAEGGSGLGLAIAKSIVQAHGGQIWAESVPGQGLTVYIELPNSSH
jgi:signal transduction histidine kinase